MKHDNGTVSAVCRLLSCGLLACMTAVQANPTAECRQEVEDYGIPPEQAAEYIAGCILSRGGTLEPAPAADAVPVAEPGDGSMPDSVPMEDPANLPLDGQAGDPLYDAGQVETMPEGAYVTY